MRNMYVCNMYNIQKSEIIEILPCDMYYISVVSVLNNNIINNNNNNKQVSPIMYTDLSINKT